MNEYTNMDLDDLYDALREEAEKFAEIAVAMDKTLILIANGKGDRPQFNIIDTDPVEVMIG